MNACDESVAAATERTRTARPSPPLAAEVPQQPLAESSSLEGSSLDYWLLSRLRSLMGNPPVEFAVRSGARVGPGVANPVARVTFAGRATLASILADPWLRFGDAYSDGRVTIDGDLVSLLETIYHASGMGGGTRASLLRRAAGALRRQHLNSLAASRDNIHYHYDIGNDFYALWLGSSMAPRSARTADRANAAHRCADGHSRLGSGIARPSRGIPAAARRTGMEARPKRPY